jgi:hypothetical protein
MGIWMTEIVIARQIAEALTEQNTAVMRAMGDRRLIRHLQPGRKSWPRDDQDLARTVAPPERVLVCGEMGGDEALFAAPMANAPVGAPHRPGTSVVLGRRQPDIVFHRSVS